VDSSDHGLSLHFKGRGVIASGLAGIKRALAKYHFIFILELITPGI